MKETYYKVEEESALSMKGASTSGTSGQRENEDAENPGSMTQTSRKVNQLTDSVANMSTALATLATSLDSKFQVF